MLETLVNIDKSLFLILNGLHAPWLDPIMYWVTQTLVWIPFYILLLGLVVRKFGIHSLWVLLFVALMIAAGDQISGLCKEGVQRLRPSQDTTLSGVHIVNGYKGGIYSFYSAHASNTFSLAVFLIVILRKQYKWIAAVMIPWAFLLSYSRIYLGVHFPGDMLAGMIAGILLGWLFGFGFQRLFRYFDPRER